MGTENTDLACGCVDWGISARVGGVKGHTPEEHYQGMAESEVGGELESDEDRNFSVLYSAYSALNFELAVPEGKREKVGDAGKAGERERG